MRRIFRRASLWLSVVVCCAGLVGGCASSPTDYGAYLDHMPKSIVVLPPLNESAEALATEAFLSTVSEPLGESGYYVYPMAVVDQMMKENGLPTAGEMHAVSLSKLGQVFGADAVMYITIKQWQIQYLVVNSSTTVRIAYRLVDIDTGVDLWSWEQTVTRSAGGLSVAGMIEAAVDAMVSAASDRARNLAVYANRLAFYHEHSGLLKGHRHPEYEADQQAKRAARQDAQAAAPGG